MYLLEQLGAGAVIAGPAILIDSTSTIVVCGSITAVDHALLD